MNLITALISSRMRTFRIFFSLDFLYEKWRPVRNFLATFIDDKLYRIVFLDEGKSLSLSPTTNQRFHCRLLYSDFSFADYKEALDSQEISPLSLEDICPLIGSFQHNTNLDNVHILVKDNETNSFVMIEHCIEKGLMVVVDDLNTIRRFHPFEITFSAKKHLQKPGNYPSKFFILLEIR